MILNILNLHNFMSYADANLDLTGVDVACLSGRNGAGKSALLDAITWCLWQNGRASSDELIKLGEKEMWVDLTFTHAGHHYRVRRSRHRSSGRSGNRAVSKACSSSIWPMVRYDLGIGINCIDLSIKRTNRSLSWMNLE